MIYNDKPLLCPSPHYRRSPGRAGSPTKYQNKDKAFDQEINKALARELYIDSTVNVVKAVDGKYSGKVKPGQMNLFQPI